MLDALSFAAAVGMVALALFTIFGAITLGARVAVWAWGLLISTPAWQWGVQHVMRYWEGPAEVKQAPPNDAPCYQREEAKHDE